MGYVGVKERLQLSPCDDDDDDDNVRLGFGAV
jgi:hypothetical protein